MMKKIITWLILQCVIMSSGFSRTLDQIVAVIDDQTITQLDVDRISDTLKARNEISPQIIRDLKLDNKQIVRLLINKKLIRERLNSLGYLITDEQVEAQIKSTEERLGLNRDALLRFLKTNSLEFDEYFELTRESIEYNIFQTRVIGPMISVTDQEIKNEYYKRNSSNSTITHKFDLVDFYVSKDALNGEELGRVESVLKNLQNGDPLRGNFAKIEANNINSVSEDGLSKEVKLQLQKMDVGDFSKPIILGNQIHIFFVKRKEMVDSELYLKQKDVIRQKIFSETEKQVIDLWFQREESKHFIKIL